MPLKQSELTKRFIAFLDIETKATAILPLKVTAVGRHGKYCLDCGQHVSQYVLGVDRHTLILCSNTISQNISHSSFPSKISKIKF